MHLAQRSGFLVALSLALSALALVADSVTIGNPFVASTVAEMQRDATVNAARAFYEFLNTGDETLLKQAVAENFTDHTLPPGRPQGPDWLTFASRRFRAAVPDLKVTLVKMIVADDYVTLLMNFAGHLPARSIAFAAKTSRSPLSPLISSGSSTGASLTAGTSKTNLRCFNRWASPR